MRAHMNFARTAAFAAFAATTALLAACGGGGGSQTVPTPQQQPSNGNKGTMASGRVTAIIPAKTTPQGASTTSTSAQRSPKYLNASDPNSAIVVSVQPTDPAEAAQWSTLYGTSGFTVCYNLYTNGVVNPALNPVPVGGGGVSVTFQIPTVPGNDAFTITQYDGQCGSNPYVPPSPSPNANGNGVLAAAPPLTVNINPGISNNLNVQLTACGAPSTTGGPCSNATPPPGTPPTTIQLGASVASVFIGGASPLPKSLAAPIPVPIPQPLREQGAFLFAGGHVGVPIPVVGLDSAGFVIAGSPATGAGALPKAGDSLTISHTETGPSGTVTGHALLYLVDATTGAIAQTEVAGTTPIKLTQLNALNAADNVSGAGTVGDPYVVVLTTDGSAATQFKSVTVTLNATLNGTAVPAQTTTITEQSALYSVAGPPGTGYPDTGGPYTAAADIVSTNGTTLPAAAQGFWITDGGNIAEAGTGRFAIAGATALTGMAFDNNTTVQRILAADSAAALGSLQTTPATGATASGLYIFDPAAHGSFPVAVQFGQTNSYIGFQHPAGVAWEPGGYVYVAENNNIWAIDPESNGAGTGLVTVTNGTTFVQAEAIGKLPVTGLNFTGVTGIGMLAIANGLLIPDPGNNRIALVNLTNNIVTTFVSGAPFVAVAAGTGTNLVATATNGQLYLIAPSGGGPVVSPFGIKTGSVTDGAVGIVAPPTAATTPAPYAVQGQAPSFFGSAPTPITLPYNLAPFAAAGPIFAPAAQAAIAGAPLRLLPDTSDGTITAAAAGAVKAPFGIVYVTPAAAGTNLALTPDSYLFTDNGTVRTLIP